jgi:DEAD/DEAH box helicase domain-containing protein
MGHPLRPGIFNHACETGRVSASSTRGEELLELLTVGPDRAACLTHVRRLPARPGRTGPWPDWAPPPLVAAWGRAGVELPWHHQLQAADLARRRTHVVMATGTASGKSLAFQLPALTAVLEARHGRRRGATVLYLSPTKALAQDQLASLSALRVPGLAACTVDGDSAGEQRDWARDHGEYVLTNPDTLHHSLLPGHPRWARFLARLQYVVVDECHHYRGVFGAHVALVLRRLRRLCARYGSDPTFVLASATVAEAGSSAGRLVGAPVEAVVEDTSARGALTLALWEPPLTEATGEHDAPVRRSALADTSDLVTDLVCRDVQTLAFVRSRRAAEIVALEVGARVARRRPDLAGRVAAYRGGYLPEDRRELERDLRESRLVGMAATNALELGIDVAGMDAVVMAGFPGTRASLWQQAGRAGRRGGEALAVLVARDDPLDTFLVHHPEALLDRDVEATTFDPGNPYVLGPHLCAAAAEHPLGADDLSLFGARSDEAVTSLTAAGLLRHRQTGWHYTGSGRASDLADLRSSGGPLVQLCEGDSGRVVGTVDAGSAMTTVHTGAVHLVQGVTYLVDELDLEGSVAHVRQDDPGYTTTARELTDIEVVATAEQSRWGRCELSRGQVRVARQVVGYLIRRTQDGTVQGEVPLHLPPVELTTQGVWWTVPDEVWQSAGLTRAELPGAAHAAEHCSIGLLPLIASCDRWDIGGVSTALHPSTGRLTVFVYDGHPGGAGFAERGFREAFRWLSATLDAIVSCECRTGCPSCVQSPKCGNGNKPLDKEAAATLLRALLAGAPRASGASPGVARQRGPA